ncbi:MAG: hypothetical protein KJ052_14160, partial [Candidatus Hydrogenedentes bacterium]|nr:hypothetical protein [Candidatus Hydrogenedentota bacterium]
MKKVLYAFVFFAAGAAVAVTGFQAIDTNLSWMPTANAQSAQTAVNWAGEEVTLYGLNTSFASIEKRVERAEDGCCPSEGLQNAAQVTPAATGVCPITGKAKDLASNAEAVFAVDTKETACDVAANTGECPLEAAKSCDKDDKG